MQIELEWLKDYVEFSFPVAEVDRCLTLGGFEVDALERVDLPGGKTADVMELNVTPNRGYGLSHLGVARELAALADLPFKAPTVTEELAKAWSDGPAIESKIKVTNTETELCPRYCAMVIEDVTVKASPQWLADRLISVGLRPINNIVDITNYVLMEYGQPLHAFDGDLLRGSEIVIRRARVKEAFTALDGTELKLEEDALVIADAEKPSALAGIMGGVGSQVTEKTKRIVLESACFDPSIVRKASKKYGLRSDSSIRFEREVDIEGIVHAQARAALMIQELAGGKICKGRIDLYPNPRPICQIELRVERVRQILGAFVEPDEISKHLRKLGFKVDELKAGETFKVEVPSFRPIIRREIDLIEEIARLRGYQHIGSESPQGAVQSVSRTAGQIATQTVRASLCHGGYSEAVNYSFIGNKNAEAYLHAFAETGSSCITLSNPLSEEMGVMRTSLIPGLLENARLNISRGQKPVKLFEVGKIFYRDASGQRVERTCLSGLAVGTYENDVWKQQGDSYDFYDIKGALESVLERLAPEAELRPGAATCWSSEKVAECVCDGEILGHVGELDSEWAQRAEVNGSIYLFEIDFGALVARPKKRAPFRAIPKFPETYRDISLLVSQSVKSKDLIEQIRDGAGPLLTRVELYDHFEGKKIEKGKKSLTFSLAFQSADKTLSDEDVNPLFEQIVQTLAQKSGASLRE
ncbi:MAG: phenylalanine--tRNA ligase subunit beta [Nitrospinae bacterium CG11_big_fil_rev_8_21_14_0_20_45_15]|nr:MAG: phenylalanine--tRNA ligase subunit beta [Nitrospinae bacterium CG11_big_fil_rev_8_21_14_0_20_45_15]